MKKKQASDPILILNENIRFLLVIELFKMGVKQTDIGKRLKMDIHSVNTLLKGIKLK